MPRRMSPKVAKTLMDAGERQARTIELYLQGWTMRRIAKELAYAGPGSVHKAIHSAIAKVPSPAVGQLRVETDEKYRLLEEQLWPIAMGKKRDVDQRLAAMDRIIRITQERRKMHGADAPASQHVQLSGEVNVKDVRQELLDRLARLSDAGAKSEDPQQPVG